MIQIPAILREIASFGGSLYEKGPPPTVVLLVATESSAALLVVSAQLLLLTATATDLATVPYCNVQRFKNVKKGEEITRVSRRSWGCNTDVNK